MNTHLNTIREEWDEAKMLDELGLEGYRNIIDFVNNKMPFISKMVVSLGTVAERISGGLDFKSSQKAIKDLKLGDVGRINAYMPMGLKSRIRPYAEHVADALEQLADIEQRLYKPLYRYIAGQIAEVREVEAIWLDKELKLISTDKLKKEYKKFFNPKADLNNTVATRRFDSLYNSMGEFMKVGEILDDAKRTVKSIDVSSIIKAEEDLVKVIDQYRRLIVAGELQVTDNRLNIKRLTVTVSAMADETAMLVSYYYQYIALNSAYKDTLDKLKQ